MKSCHSTMMGTMMVKKVLGLDESLAGLKTQLHQRKSRKSVLCWV